MKNVHLIPTDKPSRLWVNNLLQGKLELFKEFLGSNTTQHIYITSENKIKKEDYILKCKNCNDWNFKSGELKEKDYSYFVVKCVSLELINPEDKKIILTTDQDLIADGVQPIDDVFLEWFVKNPSCEKVDVYEVNGRLFADPIIPQEEPKQETLEEAEMKYITTYWKYAEDIIEPEQLTKEDIAKLLNKDINSFEII